MNVKNRQTQIIGMNFTASKTLRASINLTFSPDIVIVRQCSWVSGEAANQGHAVIYTDLLDYSPQLCIIRDEQTDSPSIEHPVSKSKIAHGIASFEAYISGGSNIFVPSSPANLDLKGTCLFTLEFIEYDKK